MKFYLLLCFAISPWILLAQDSTLVSCAEPKSHFKKIEFLFCQVPETQGFSHGICWSTTPEPSLFDQFNIFSPSLEEFKFSVNQLNPNTDYYFRLFRLFENGEVRYEPSFVLQTLPEVHVGEYYQGGIVGFIFRKGDSLYVEGEQHGVILSPDELGYAYWGMYGQAIDGGTSTRVGHGKENTDAIVKQFLKTTASNTTINHNDASVLQIIQPCAALLCQNYQNGGWSDWFLPSSNDLHLVFSNYDSLKVLNLSQTENYWSSSEVFFSWRLRKSKRRPTRSQYRRAWNVRFHSSMLMTSAMTRKDKSSRVRAVRYF